MNSIVLLSWRSNLKGYVITLCRRGTRPWRTWCSCPGSEPPSVPVSLTLTAGDKCAHSAVAKFC
jgi:hypothetical protein